MLIGEILYKKINTEDTDYIIKFQDNSCVYVHKLVLAQYSRVFARATKSSQCFYQLNLDLKNIPKDTFMAFLEYCYLGKLRNVPKIKELAILLENPYLFNKLTNKKTKLRISHHVL